MAVEQALLALIGAADVGGAYRISRSLRFNSADSAYLSRTPGSAGNRRTWTFSAWIKRGKLGSAYTILGARGSSPNEDDSFLLFFKSTDAITIGYGNNDWKTTTQVFRDCSAWYHLVLAFDSTQATAADRIKLYVNGTQVTSFTVTSDPTQNLDSAINKTVEQRIGSYASVAANPFDGYIADVYLLDGTATTPSTFAETDAITGQWVPKTPTSISYGTNGFRLTFSDNSGTTSTTLGKDAAGSNNFTPNNFSVASGSGNDSLVDSPTSYGTDTGAGGEVRGNYSIVNPLNKGSAVTLANGNLDASVASSGAQVFWGTIGVSTGKWYFEFTQTSGTFAQGVGIKSTFVADANNNYLYVGYDGNKVNASGSNSAYGATWGNNDVIGVAFDLDAGTITFYKNGTSQGQAFSGLPSATYFPYGVGWSGGTWAATMNFGQRAFAYTAPSGFKALVDTNLTAPTIAKPANYFDAITYTGNNSSGRTVTGYNFGPELVWIKRRDSGTGHIIQDVIRGTGVYLGSDSTAGDSSTGGTGSSSAAVQSFDSNGFTLGTGAGVNANTGTYVAWAWDAASSNSTNTSGTITSTVRANATAGFSIVTWTTPSPVGTMASIGHGLNATPKLIITKNRDLSQFWTVYHGSLSNLSQDYLKLNSTDGAVTRPSTLWGTVNSTVFNVDQAFIANANEKQVAYCFAPVAGYSAFGSYTANASTDGPFVYLGFKPKWIMIKAASSSGDMSYASWLILDTSRSSYNICSESLYANASYQEGLRGNGTSSGAYLDMLSNGFKIKYNGSEVNGVNGQTYIYAAFAESPFQYARAR